jgi:hypothetical protein
MEPGGLRGQPARREEPRVPRPGLVARRAQAEPRAPPCPQAEPPVVVAPPEGAQTGRRQRYGCSCSLASRRLCQAENGVCGDEATRPVTDAAITEPRRDDVESLSSHLREERGQCSSCGCRVGAVETSFTRMPKPSVGSETDGGVWWRASIPSRRTSWGTRRRPLRRLRVRRQS